MTGRWLKGWEMGDSCMSDRETGKQGNERQAGRRETGDRKTKRQAGRRETGDGVTRSKRDREIRRQ